VSLFGRNEIAWDELAAVGEAFLIERARLARLTSYSELNATLTRRTGLAGFDSTAKMSALRWATCSA
jgi:hypothetical protein